MWLVALAQYSDLFWYPSGAIAAGVAVRIFPHDSNVLAPLFTDATGTVPLANPLTTSATGTIEFWAEAGLYWMHADSESFEIGVGLTPGDPNAIAELQNDVLQLQTEMNAVESDVTVLEGAMLAVQGDITAVEGDVATLQADVTAVEGDVNVLQSSMLALQTDVSNMSDAVISTGVVHGGILTANGVDPGAVNISAVTAYVVDDITDPENPIITHIEEPDRTVQLDAAAQLRVITWWIMAADGTLTQQADNPTPEQRRAAVVLGRTSFNPLTGAVIGAKSIQVDLQQDPNQLADLMDALGPFSLTGNRVTAVAGTLQFNKSAGVMFSRGSSHDVAHDNPHEHDTPAQSPAQFRRLLQTSASVTPLVNVIDPLNYDVGGVLTPVAGGAGSTTIQRVWLNPADTTVDQISVQYGQTVYSSLAAGVDAIGTGTFIATPGIESLAVIIAYIVVTRVATNLADLAQARIVTGTKFPTP